MDVAVNMKVTNLNGTYFTEAVTADAVNWLEHEVPRASVGTFAYLAHESNHAPVRQARRLVLNRV